MQDQAEVAKQISREIREDGEAKKRRLNITEHKALSGSKEGDRNDRRHPSLGQGKGLACGNNKNV